MNGVEAAKTIYPVVLKVPEEKRALKGSEKVRFLSEFARLALQRSAALLGVSLPPLKKRENGAPIPAGGVFWSLSHKSGCVAAAASLEPVGIDVEKIRPFRAGLYDKIADETEQALFSGNHAVDFFQCWTAKEAVLKAAGVGMAGLSGCRITTVNGIDTLSAAFGELFWTVKFRFSNGHLAAVAVNRSTVSWIAPERANGGLSA